MQRTVHPLLSPSLGVSKAVTSLHFGTPGSRPKVYIQASLHAEELPGMLVAHHLRAMLEAAQAQGLIQGEIVLVPVANPIGLAQRMDHKPMGRFEFDLYGQTAAWYSLTVLLILFALARRWVNSPWGATLMAVRDNPLRAMAIGIPVHNRLAVVYTVAAALAGAAGALMAQTTGFASLDVFALERSADVMLMLVIGGVGWLYGGVVGAVVFKLMHDVISGITPQYWTFWIGLFLVVLVMVGRERLIRPWRWFGRAADQKGGAQ
mgnify:CR=1 FL=1